VGKQIHSQERRRHERYPCEFIAACGPATGSEEQVLEGKVVEISRGGLLVAVGRRFEAGAILRVRVTRQVGGSMTTLLARVVHVRPEQDGEWLLGCRLAKDFDEVDLQALLRDPRFNSAHD
jgi:PilZ domain